MEKTAVEDNASLLKTRHFWLIVGGIVLIAVSNAGEILHERGIPWESFKALLEKGGEAAIIGGIVARMLDVNLVRSVSKILDDQVKRINKDVYEGILGSLTDPALFSVYNKTVMKCPVYRDNVKLSLTLTPETHIVRGNQVTLLKCEWHEEYFIHSLQAPSASHPLEIVISTDDVKGMEHLCGITLVKVGQQNYTGNPFLGKVLRPGSSDFTETLNVQYGVPLLVESYSIAYKTMSDAESFEINLPSKNVELEVTVVGCNLIVRSHIMCAEGASEGWKHNKNGVSHWIAGGAMLPHQGIALSWTPA